MAPAGALRGILATSLGANPQRASGDTARSQPGVAYFRLEDCDAPHLFETVENGMDFAAFDEHAEVWSMKYVLLQSLSTPFKNISTKQSLTLSPSTPLIRS